MCAACGDPTSVSQSRVRASQGKSLLAGFGSCSMAAAVVCWLLGGWWQKESWETFSATLASCRSSAGRAARPDGSLAKRVPLTGCSELSCRSVAHLGCCAAEPSCRAARAVA